MQNDRNRLFFLTVLWAGLLILGGVLFMVPPRRQSGLLAGEGGCTTEHSNQVGVPLLPAIIVIIASPRHLKEETLLAARSVVVTSNDANVEIDHLLIADARAEVTARDTEDLEAVLVAALLFGFPAHLARAWFMQFRDRGA